MANFDNSADMGKQLIFKFILERMEEKQITEFKLANIIGVPRSTLNRNFKGDTEMNISTFLKICGALEIQPFLVPKEISKTEFKRMFFN